MPLMPTGDPGAIKAGAAYIEIGTHLGPLAKGLLATRMHLMKLAKFSLGLGAIILAPFAIGVKGATSFQDEMSKVSTMLTDQTMHLLPAMTAGVRDLSVGLGQATEVLGAGLYSILSAQVPAAHAMRFLEESAEAAVAGNTEVNTIVQAATKVMKAYRMSLDDTGDTMDFLFTILARGQGDMSDFAGSLPMVTAQAAMAGLKMEELGAAVATASRLLPSARRTTMSLNAALLAMIAPTEKAASLAKKHGVQMDMQTIRTKGLLFVLKQLKGIPADVLAQIFPARGLRAIAALLQDIEGYQSDLAAMYDRSGEKSKAFEKRAGTLAFQIARIRMAIADMFVGLGTQFLPGLTRAGSKVVMVIRGITGWIEANQQLLAVIAKIGVALVLLGASLLFISAILKLLAVLMGPKGVFMLVALSMVMVTDALGWTNTGLLELVENFRIGGLKIKTWMTVLALELMVIWEKIKLGAESMWDAIGTAARWMITGIRANFLEALAWLFEKFTYTIQGIIDTVNNMITTINDILGTDLGTLELNATEWGVGLEEAAKQYRAEQEKLLKGFDERQAKRQAGLAKKRGEIEAAQAAVVDEDVTAHREELAKGEAKNWREQMEDAARMLQEKMKEAMAGVTGVGAGADRKAIEVGAYLGSVRGMFKGGTGYSRSETLLEKQLGVQEEMLAALEEGMGGYTA